MRQFAPGIRYGRLTIIEPTDKRYFSNIIYRCKCDCGNECFVPSGSLGKGTNSCGCLEKENRIKHNMSNSKLYNVWINMKQRCDNPHEKRYKNYGGRGITYCNEWKDFEPFYKWAMEVGYNPNAPKGQCTLDRIDVNGNYEPKNCRWITNKEQQNNKTDSVYHEYNGESHTISQWADILNLPLNILKGRLSKGWDIKRTLEQPIKHTKKYYESIQG